MLYSCYNEIAKTTEIYWINVNRSIRESKVEGEYFVLKDAQNALTLGMIILLTVIATLPRTITGMYSYAVGGSEKAISVMWLTNKIMLVNPLVDPFIYIFRIKRCRDRLTCKRCGKTNDDIETTI